jgi:iron complex outermembrane receptor protein
MDYTPNCFDEVTVQGDIYQGYSGGAQVLPAPAFPFVNPVQNRSFVRGANALTRWTRTLSDESDFAVQMYYDRTERDSATGSEDRDVFDVDFQHRFPIGCAHKMIWGGRYRSSKDLFRAVNPFAITIAPTERTLDTISFFVQDEIELVDDTLFFTVGSKFEETTSRVSSISRADGLSGTRLKRNRSGALCRAPSDARPESKTTCSSVR